MTQFETWIQNEHFGKCATCHCEPECPWNELRVSLKQCEFGTVHMTGDNTGKIRYLRNHGSQATDTWYHQ